MFRLALFLCLFSTGVFAQSADPTTLQALLTEVHQLRLAIERAASATPRIQITLQRLLVQEQKVERISRELSGIRQGMTNVSGEQARMTQMSQDLETRIAQEQNPSRRNELERQRSDIRAGAERFARMVQQNQAQETELGSSLRLEQARLDELSDRLTALDRSLEAPRQ